MRQPKKGARRQTAGTKEEAQDRNERVQSLKDILTLLLHASAKAAAVVAHKPKYASTHKLWSHGIEIG